MRPCTPHDPLFPVDVTERSNVAEGEISGIGSGNYDKPKLFVSDDSHRKSVERPRVPVGLLAATIRP